MGFLPMKHYELLFVSFDCWGHAWHVNDRWLCLENNCFGQVNWSVCRSKTWHWNFPCSSNSVFSQNNRSTEKKPVMWSCGNIQETGFHWQIIVKIWFLRTTSGGSFDRLFFGISVLPSLWKQRVSDTTKSKVAQCIGWLVWFATTLWCQTFTSGCNRI